MTEPSVAVLIPIYKNNLTPAELLSLQKAEEILGRYPIIFVKPQDLNIDNLLQKYPNLQFQNFDNQYFESIQGYNQLLTSPEFYKRFWQYDYILIYQLDALVFRDELMYWCKQGYDYIGAPAIPQKESIFDTKLPVLNGGLSLRHVKKCHRLVKSYRQIFGKWLGNEDMVFSMAAGRLIPFRGLMRLPHWKQALGFAFEQNLQESFELNNHKIPFGAHAWEKYDKGFWKNHIDFL